VVKGRIGFHTRGNSGKQGKFTQVGAVGLISPDLLMIQAIEPEGEGYQQKEDQDGVSELDGRRQLTSLSPQSS